MTLKELTDALLVSVTVMGIVGFVVAIHVLSGIIIRSASRRLLRSRNESATPVLPRSSMAFNARSETPRSIHG
jgi:hypothetical protein